MLAEVVAQLRQAGKTVVFTTSGTEGGRSVQSIWSMELDGEQLTRVTQSTQASAAAPEYQIVGMGVGSPGRPASDHKEGPYAFVVAPTSAENLERKDHKGELDGVNLQKLFQEKVPVPLFVNNDAIVQMQRRNKCHRTADKAAPENE